ncbi:unnamed protein product, partial [Ectocarpus sp. 12 AP-2014]
MFGVVLWSDRNDSKAVVWCEDHGDLAYFSEPLDDEGCRLEIGDLIHFEVSLEQDLRLVQKPRKVTNGAFQGLADTLRMLPTEGPVVVPGKCQDEAADVIALD